MNEFTICKHCEKNIHFTELHVEEVDGATVIGCPLCHRIMSVKTEATELDYSAYLPTVDECNYNIHILNKQIDIVEKRHTILHNLITKYEIMRELTRENGRS